MGAPAYEEFESHKAVTRLDEMGLREADLVDAAQWGVNHLLESTSNEPPSGPGSIVWIKTVRALREKLLPKGWSKDDSNNYATVVSPDGSMAIAVAAGDSRTGKPGIPLPTTKNRKGKVTKMHVGMNQLSFEQISKAFPAAKKIKGKTTWILLLSVDEENDMIVSELSLPHSIEKNGFISEWSERIILPAVPFGSMTSEEDDEGEPPIEIDVQPR